MAFRRCDVVYTGVRNVSLKYDTATINTKVLNVVVDQIVLPAILGDALR